MNRSQETGPSPGPGRPRRRFRAVLGLAALAALALTAYLGTDLLTPRFSPERVPRLLPRAVTLTRGVHLLGGLSPSSAYAVETAKGLVLVDSGLEPDAGVLRSQLQELGLDWRRVRAVLLTHAHGDHCGGAEFLRRATGAKVYAGKADVPVIQVGGPREAVFSTFYMPVDTRHPTAVDVPLEGGETLDFGDVHFRAIATPGHTPGSTCYLLERPGLRAFFAGDIVMKLKGDVPPRDEFSKPLGTYAAYLAPRYRGDAEKLLTTFHTLQSMKVPDLVLPGHPTADPEPQSPCLSQARWEELFEAGIRDMETLVARFRADGAGFLDGQAKHLRGGLDYLGDEQGTAVYALTVGSKLYLVNAPGGPGLEAFVLENLRRLGRDPAALAGVLLTSGAPRDSAGLAGLLAKYPAAAVVAPADALPELKTACPAGTRLIPADRLGQENGFPAAVHRLEGRDHGTVGYEVALDGKTALFTGRVPIKITQDTGVALFNDFLNGQGNVDEYLASVARLSSLKPDLWLPSQPVDGQNAFLYDDDWARLVDDNRRGIEMNRNALARPPR